MRATAGLSALRIDEAGVGHFYSTTKAPAAVLDRFVSIAERDGLLVPSTVDGPCFAVLDIVSDDGDIIADRAVPDEAAWNAINSELRLTVIASES